VAQNAHIWMANVGTSIKPAFVQNGGSRSSGGRFGGG